MMGVSEILIKAGQCRLDDIPIENRLFGLERGNRVHEACALYDEHDLDETDLDPEIVPRLKAWKAFRKDTGFTPLIATIEKPALHIDRAYCGTADVLGLINGEVVLADRKCGDYLQYWRLQVAAYCGIWSQIWTSLMKGIAVQLRADGSYRVYGGSWSPMLDFGGGFLPALRLARWLNETGGV